MPALKHALGIAAFLLISCATSDYGLAVEADDWCRAGTTARVDGPWKPLGRGAVVPVALPHLPDALKRLRSHTHVPVSKSLAEKLAESALQSEADELIYLARAGILGGPSATLEQYVTVNRERIRFSGSVSRDGRKVVIHTFTTSLPYPSRRFAVLVKVRPTVTSIRSECASVV